MTRSKTDFRDALTSGNADQVNDAIDEAEGLEAEERARLFDKCFDEFTDLYQEGDGYQRLSVVRFLREIAVPELSDEYWNRLWDFFIVAVQDDDGRVRTAVAKAIFSLAVVAQARDEPANPLQKLEGAADGQTGKIQQDIEKLIDRIQQLVSPPLNDILGEFDDSVP
jgi:hypothetical protein